MKKIKFYFFFVCLTFAVNNACINRNISAKAVNENIYTAVNLDDTGLKK